MNIVEEIKRQMGIKTTPSHSPSVRPEISALRESLEAGQRAKRAENYPVALEALNHASRLAIAAGDTNALSIAALNLADVYIAQKRWAEADDLLQKTYQTAKESRQRPQMAYILCEQGVLAEAQNDWANAQKYYEQALETARTSRAPGAEGRAMGNLADVYLHDSNASYAIHLLREALPRLNMTGDIELSSYFVGRLGEALIEAGQTVEGQQMLERALRLAKQLNYRREQRRWGILLGQRAFNEGRVNDAYDAYQEALSLFAAEQQDAQFVEALCQMSRICLSLGEQDEALRHAQRAGDVKVIFENLLLRAQTRATLGIVQVARHDAEGAIPELEAAAETYAGLPDQSGTTELDVLRTLAAAYAEANQDDKVIQTYRRAVKRAEDLNLPLESAQTYRDLGLYYAQHHHMQDAFREWQAALSIYQSNNQNAQAARLLCDIAAARKYLGQGQRAMKDYEEALMLLSSLLDDMETRGLVLANAAIAYADQGDVDSADSFFNEAIAIAKRTNNEPAEATRRGNYGWFLMATGRPQQALSALEFALRMSETLNLDLQRAIQTDNLGLVHDAQANYPQALQYHQQALELIQSKKQPHWESMFKINKAHTLLSLRQIEAVRPLLEAALAQGRADEDVEVIIRSLTGLARLIIHQEDSKSAEPLLNEAIALARRADMRRLLAEALGIYSEQQAQQNQAEHSRSLWEEAQKLFNMLRAPQGKTEPSWLN